MQYDKISQIIIRGKRGSDSLMKLKEKLDRLDPTIDYDIEYLDWIPGSQITIFYKNGKGTTINSPFYIQQLHDALYKED